MRTRRARMGARGRRLAVAGCAATLALIAVGCGAASTSRTQRATPATKAAATRAAGAFAWVGRAPSTAGWRRARIPTGASIAYPPSWRPTESDAGTRSEVLRSADGDLLGYLNLTPRTADESLASWPSFRVDHNGEEHDTHVHALASARGLRFAAGTGSCVRDRYTTTTAAHYVEIACLVIGHGSGVVAVGAAPPTAWPRLASQLERAINSVRT